VKWGRNLRLSVRAISRARTRTLLSVSGVAIGIAAVAMLIGAGVGAERALRKALEPLGHNLLSVNTGQTRSSALRGAGRLGTTLTIADWHAIEESVPGVLRTAPIAGQTLGVRVGGRTVDATVTGTTAEFGLARNFPVIAGRFIDDDDVAEMQRVAVVGALVVEDLFLGESPLGEVLFIAGVPFRIVGVAKKKGVSPDGINEDEFVIIPLTTAMRRLLSMDYLARVYVQAVSEEAIPAVRSKIAALLRERHGLIAGRPDDFKIRDQTAIVRAQQAVGGSLSRIVTSLSALALVLGGVGLLAISMLSVRERYCEIGLRLAVGGRPADILLQFLTETVLISLLGGVVGLAVGAAGIGIGASMTRWPMALDWQAVVYPLGISVAIAVIFGVYPALRAARLDPIAALNSR
jgi:putative ABC transport system permease protein